MLIQMFGDKLKNLFKRSVEAGEDESLFERAANLLNSNRRTTYECPTNEFEHYLASIPWQELEALRSRKPRPKKTATLRPELAARCYKNVPAAFFDPNYQVTQQFFTRNRREAHQKTSKMHQCLDEVEICLFNQISSRFDEILAVLRTIESLECVVDFNSSRLKAVRGQNLSLAKQASKRHLRITALLRKQERLKAVLSTLAQVKIYTSFTREDVSTLTQRQHSHRYEQIGEIRLRRSLYFQLESTRNFEQRLEELQANLKKSYSDSVNDAFFKYAIEVVPYDPQFWLRRFSGRTIFEQEEPEADGTVVLDESVIVHEEEHLVQSVRTDQASEVQVVANLLTGWKEGDYSVNTLKAALEKFIREKHHVFVSDCRNFCFDNYLREERAKIENPNISNLMQHMNVYFCSKVATAYADIYRTLLTRAFSVGTRTVRALIEASLQPLSIQEKEKAVLIVEGIVVLLSSLFRTAYQRIIEFFQLKKVYDSMQLQDFKQLVNVLETEQEFIQKHLSRFLKFDAKGSFLQQLCQQAHDKIDLDIVTRAKEEKVLTFLNKTHRFIIENQLRESFENEIWKPTDIPTFYYDSLHYLITGESLNLRRNRNHTIRHNLSTNFESSVFIDRMGQEGSVLIDQQLISRFRIIRNEIIVEGRTYKVTGTLLLLLEFIEDYLHLAQYYPFAKQEVGSKIYQLLRAYHTTSHQLIFLAGAVKLQKIKTKTITARHLALNSLCLSFLLYVVDCLRTRVPLPEEQKIRNQLLVHQDNIIKRLASILSTKYSQAMAEVVLGTVPSKGTQAIVNNTKNLHDILIDFYQKDTLRRIFVRNNVEVYLTKLRSLEVHSKLQAEALKDDLNFYFHQLKFLNQLIGDFQQLRLQAEDIIRIKFQQL